MNRLPRRVSQSSWACALHFSFLDGLTVCHLCPVNRRYKSLSRVRRDPNMNYGWICNGKMRRWGAVTTTCMNHHMRRRQHFVPPFRACLILGMRPVLDCRSDFITACTVHEDGNQQVRRMPCLSVVVLVGNTHLQTEAQPCCRYCPSCAHTFARDLACSHTGAPIHTLPYYSELPGFHN